MSLHIWLIYSPGFTTHSCDSVRPSAKGGFNRDTGRKCRVSRIQDTKKKKIRWKKIKKIDDEKRNVRRERKKKKCSSMSLSFSEIDRFNKKKKGRKNKKSFHFFFFHLDNEEQTILCVQMKINCVFWFYEKKKLSIAKQKIDK